jgi:hypothetical protein
VTRQYTACKRRGRSVAVGEVMKRSERVRWNRAVRSACKVDRKVNNGATDKSSGCVCVLCDWKCVEIVKMLTY